VRAFMESQLKQKKIISINLTRIDLENLLNGETLTSPIKTGFEVEIPYELIMKREGVYDESNI